MTQQCGDSGRGNDQTPQKFVHLVGCRDPKVRPEPWIRPRLAAVKQKYDPEGLFIVHHGVGSEQWLADGFTRVLY